jgi:hypothetical protein
MKLKIWLLWSKLLLLTIWSNFSATPTFRHHKWSYNRCVSKNGTENFFMIVNWNVILFDITCFNYIKWWIFLSVQRIPRKALSSFFCQNLN